MGWWNAGWYTTQRSPIHSYIGNEIYTSFLKKNISNRKCKRRNTLYVHDNELKAPWKIQANQIGRSKRELEIKNGPHVWDHSKKYEALRTSIDQ